MNGVLSGELVNLENNENKNQNSVDNKLIIDQIYELNNNNLNQICKQEQYKLSQQLDLKSSRLSNQSNTETKDRQNAKVDEEQMNVINHNLNTFNMLQQNYKNEQNKSHYQTLYGHHRLSPSNLLNTNANNKTTSQGQLSSQISQYELKSGSTIKQYELSQEMLDKRVEVLMRKYGDKAWQAAMLIQRFWRSKQMSKRFHNLALGNQQQNNGTSQLIRDNSSELTSKSVNDLNLSGGSDGVKNSTCDPMDLKEISDSEIIITDKTHPLNNGITNNTTSQQQKLINATLEALKTPLTDSQTNNQLINSQTMTKSSITNRSIMKRYSNASNASLQSTSSSGSSSNASMPRSPTMPALQKNVFYNTGSILTNCTSTTAATTTPIKQHSTSHILLNSSPLHPNTLITNGQANQLIYANPNNIYSNVCLTNNSPLINNPYFKSSQTTPVLTPQHSLLNAMIPAYVHPASINNSNGSQTNGGSAMSLQSCLSNNLSRQSILSTLSNQSLMFNSSAQQQLHQQQLAKQQQIQISQYETLRKRQYRIGLNLFNKRPPNRGIQYLIENGFIDVNLLNYAGFLIDGGLDSGLGSLASESFNSISTDKSNTTNITNNSSTNGVDKTPERELQLAAAVARFLLTRKGLSKQMIGEYLGDLQKPFNQLVLKFFVKQMDLSGLLIDVALRKFQTYFRFPGEAQKIEKLVEVFSEKYYQCNFENGINSSFYDAYFAASVSNGRLNLDEEEANPEKIGLRVMTKDEIFILSFAIIMLNTDLHIPNNKRRMTPEQWIKNLKGVFKEGDLNEIFLLDVYERIKQNEFKTGHDNCNHVLKVQQTLVPSSSAKQVPNFCLTSYCRLVCFCRLYEIIDINKKTTKVGQHQREVFLFNDMLLITKLAKSSAFTGSSLTNNGGGHSSSASTHNQYSYRRSIPLSGCTVSLFTTNYYTCGIKLSQKTANQSNGSSNSNKCHIMFNARNDIDRKKFFEDLKESICEINEMEMIRISNGCNGLTAVTSTNNNNLSSSSSSSSASSSISSASSSNCTQQSQQSKNLSNSLLDLVKI